jgi:hypothetical protein
MKVLQTDSSRQQEVEAVQSEVDGKEAFAFGILVC